MKYRAFTMTELLVGMVIVAISAAVFSLNMDAFNRHTAEHQAEKVAAFLNGKLRRSAINGVGFYLTVNEDNLIPRAGIYSANMTTEDALSADKGCSFVLYAKSDSGYTSSTSMNRLYCGTSDTPPNSNNWYRISDGSSARTSTQEEGEYYIQVRDSEGNLRNVIIGK